MRKSAQILTHGLTAQACKTLRTETWYIDAQTFCHELATEFALNPYICASVISCLSPNNKWQRNKVDARAVLVAWQAGLTADSVKVCTYNANKAKAFRVLNEGEAIAQVRQKLMHLL
jgi:hypothetical protein